MFDELEMWLKNQLFLQTSLKSNSEKSVWSQHSEFEVSILWKTTECWENVTHFFDTGPVLFPSSVTYETISIFK